MSFVDKVTGTVEAGKGGDGKLSWRREKFIDKGGPNGGDGGKGGDVILEASRNQNTLAAFRYKKSVKADDGQPGDKQRMHGKSGKDLIVPVPVGTTASDSSGKIVADLTADGQQAVIAKGGQGGFGNAHFVSSRRQSPNFAEKGEPGETFELVFELKMIADIGLVGLPNAGKSTLLSKLSNARPEIANYPFTTLTPNLGVVDIDKDTSILMADIPGLIEGAAQGKGLGHDFLRHIERTAAVLHLIDAYSDDPVRTYNTVRGELKAYSADLIKRPEIVALTKVEGLDDEIIKDLIKQLKKAVPKDTLIMAISAQAGTNLPDLLFKLKETVRAARAKRSKAKTKPAIPVLTLDDTSGAFTVEKDGDKFVVTGERIEKFASRTDFASEEGLQRLRDIMRRAGVIHELKRQGVEPGQKVQIAGLGSFAY
jgi:GTP-binding protein